MAVVAIKIKVLPESPETNLDEMKVELEQTLMKLGALKINSITEEPIAFGLSALIVFLAWPEEKDTSLIEEAIKAIKDVSSEEIIDYRRAFG